MVGRGHVPSPGDLSSSRGRGRASDSTSGRGRTLDSSVGRGQALDSIVGRGRASDSDSVRGRASDSTRGHGRTLDSSVGRGRALDSSVGRGRASNSIVGRGRASDSNSGRGRASDSSGVRRRASESSGGRGQASDSSRGRGRASDSIPGCGPTSDSSRGHGCGQISPLSHEVSKTLGNGYAGSSSQAGGSDPMADMNGVLRHQQREEFHHEGSQHGFNTIRDHAESLNNGDYDEEDEDTTHFASNAADMPHIPPQREFIFRVGKKFAKGKVHRVIRSLFDGCFDGAWATYKQVPREVVDHIFDRFRTRYTWDPTTDYAIKEGVENVLKRRFADIMSEHRNASAKNAKAAGFIFPEDKPDFGIMCDFPPHFVHPDVWHDLCMGWNTEAWRKKSERGRKNRHNADNNDVISRHTGGSRGYDEHRVILERTLGRIPTFKELFLATHLTKDSKKKFWAGPYDENLEGAEFCTTRSKKAYEAYVASMIDRYGEDVTQHPVGDAELWERTQGGSGFGIGSSDSHFVITGTPSSSSGSTLSYA